MGGSKSVHHGEPGRPSCEGRRFSRLAERSHPKPYHTPDETHSPITTGPSPWGSSVTSSSRI